MRQSNLYIILYAMGLTVVCAGLLAFASQALKPRQDANVELERKTNVLSTVMTLGEGVDIEKILPQMAWKGQGDDREVLVVGEGQLPGDPAGLVAASGVGLGWRLQQVHAKIVGEGITPSSRSP